MSWRDEAECKDGDYTCFFPDDIRSSSERYVMIQEAKAICKACSVRKQCLEVALQFKEPFGIWGGKTETERRTILRKRHAYHAA